MRVPQLPSRPSHAKITPRASFRFYRFSFFTPQTRCPANFVFFWRFFPSFFVSTIRTPPAIFARRIRPLVTRSSLLSPWRYDNEGPCMPLPRASDLAARPHAPGPMDSRQPNDMLFFSLVSFPPRSRSQLSDREEASALVGQAGTQRIMRETMLLYICSLTLMPPSTATPRRPTLS